MKHKIRSWLLGIVLAFPLLAPFARVYADTATLYLSPASKSVSKGSILTVSVRENSGGEPVNSVQANLSYPAELLDFVSVSSSSAWGVVAQNSGGGGSVQIARGALPAVTGDQLVASVRFKAKADSGTASISFASGSAVVSANSNKDVKSGERGASYTLKAASAVTPSPSAAEQPKDTAPPSITNITSNEVTATTAVISWTTSEPSSSEVVYGPTNGYGIAASDANMVTEHKVSLSSPLIAPGTKYHFMVKSIDPSGNAASGEDSTFTTVGATLEATVVNQSGKPIKGAEVTFGEISGTTGKDGKVTLKNLPLGSQTGTVSYRGKQAPATVRLDTLDKNGKPHTATFKIDVSSDMWLRILVIILLAALAGMFLYRRSGGSGGPQTGAGSGSTGKNSLDRLVSSIKTLLNRLKGLLPKKETSIFAKSSQPTTVIPPVISPQSSTLPANPPSPVAKPIPPTENNK